MIKLSDFQPAFSVDYEVRMEDHLTMENPVSEMYLTNVLKTMQNCFNTHTEIVRIFGDFLMCGRLGRLIKLVRQKMNYLLTPPATPSRFCHWNLPLTSAQNHESSDNRIDPKS